MESSGKHTPNSLDPMVDKSNQIDGTPSFGPIEYCPKCNCEIKPFYLNFEEMILMCENVDCDYPLSDKPLSLIKVTEETDRDFKLISMRSKIISLTDRQDTPAVTDNPACHSEIIQVIKTNDSAGFGKKSNKAIIKKEMHLQKIDEITQNNINAITQLTSKLCGKKNVIIKNKKFIDNLKMMQMSTKKKTLQSPAMAMYNPIATKVHNRGKVKINISSNADKTSSISVELESTENN